jgi:hypothetical protein
MLGEVFQRFVEKSPIAVMVRGLLVAARNKKRLGRNQEPASTLAARVYVIVDGNVATPRL